MNSPQREPGRVGLLIILDGFGINADSHSNATVLAKTPTLSRLKLEYPHGELSASESHVGLPDGFMGNSEVGHLNIGAGRIVYQDFSLISQAIEGGQFFKNPAFVKLLREVRDEKRQATLHLMGLVSDGGVHSHISHLMALIKLCREYQLKKIAVHVFTDGRDTSPTSAAGFLRKLKEYMGDGRVGTIATIMGRFYAMDRDTRWERTEAAYQAIVTGNASQSFSNPVSWIEKQYDQGTTDEFLPPAVMNRYEGIRDGDGVIFFNFRADRARQLTRAITQVSFPFFKRKYFPALTGFVSMSPYDDTLKLPAAFEKVKVPNTLGEIVSKLGWKQLRIAETEKYAHVTYFFNGGDETVFEGEKRVLVPSPRDVETYDRKPEMSAEEVTARLLDELNSTSYQFVVVNFANPDMVGHTGNLRAAIRAVEVVDGCLKKIVDWVESQEAFAILTADHGNCEMMQDKNNVPLTSHTLQPVPIIVIDRDQRFTVASGGRLCDIAPTLLELWGIPQPKEMTGKSLILAEKN